MIIWVIVTILLSLRSATSLDELLSARCQAKCLNDFELVVKHDIQRRRQLKHRIINLCKNDTNCSSCATTCREPFDNIDECIRRNCQSIGSYEHCERSCHFLRHIYSEKPGVCPKPRLLVTDECVASCRRDGDCSETMKCCSNGCGRSCVPPTTANQATLLARPTNVVANERKRGRSAVVRWTMQGMSRRQANTPANLYVVQWKWGVREQQARMSHWRTITIRNKMYAILKHLLSSGRYYLFRVAAVDLHGSRGYSQPSQPFKLSKEVKAPGRPRDLSLGQMLRDSSNLVVQHVHWQPPISDLPITHYRIVWQVSNDRTIDDLSRMTRHHRLISDEQGDELPVDGRESRIVPASENSFGIRRLKSDHLYMIQVSAIVDSEFGELQGEKAVVFVKTSFDNLPLITDHMYHSTVMPTPVVTTVTPTTLTVPSHRSSLVTNLHVAEPQYDNGHLTAVLTWRSPAVHRRRFVVTWWPSVCTDVHLRPPSTGHSLETAHRLVDLQFDCRYLANVTGIVGGRPNRPVQIAFSTPKCDHCRLIDSIDDLNCRPIERAPVGAVCTWTPGDDSVTGYRVVSGKRQQMDGSSGSGRDSVHTRMLPSSTTEVTLAALEEDTEYVVQVQTISAMGVGKSVHTVFTFPSDYHANDLDEQVHLERITPSAASFRPLSPLLIVISFIWFSVTDNGMRQCLFIR